VGEEPKRGSVQEPLELLDLLVEPSVHLEIPFVATPEDTILILHDVVYADARAFGGSHTVTVDVCRTAPTSPSHRPP
jgi:hypothetical protein